MVRSTRGPLRPSNHQENDGEEDETNQENAGKENVRRRSLIESFHRRSSSMSVTTLSDVAKQALYKSRRRSSMADGQCLPLGLSNEDSSLRSQVLDRGKNKSYTQSISRASLSSGRALWRSALETLKGNGDGRSTANRPNQNGELKPILTFRGGSAWQYLEEDRPDLYLDLFWPTKKENPFRPDVMPLEGLAPLCNFRHLTFLKLTGMMRSYQKCIWQAVWLNPGLEVLELEMGLEPCIRRTFNAGWPSIKGDWTYETADDVCNNYHGDDGQGTLERRIGVGEYLDKQAIAQARYRAMLLGCSLTQLPIVKLSLTGFVVDAGPFFHWFNPHRLRMIDFKNDCVDAGFVLPNAMSEHVVVSWPKKTVEHVQYARRVPPGEIKLVDLGGSSAPRKGDLRLVGSNNKKEQKESAAKKDRRKMLAQKKLKKKAGSMDRLDSAQHDGQRTGGLPRTQSNVPFNLFSVSRGFWKN